MEIKLWSVDNIETLWRIEVTLKRIEVTLWIKVTLRRIGVRLWR